jgi:hypothetical protein
MNLAPTVRVVFRYALPAVLLALVCMTASAPAQSLGDVARQEQARRKSASAGKIYTNDDLRSAPAPASTTPASTGSTSATGDAKSSPATAAPADAKSDTKTDTKSAADTKGADAPAEKTKDKDPSEDEATWRKRQNTIQESLDRARTFSEALQSRINGLTAEFSAKDDPAQRGVVATERQKALTELDRVKKEIQQHTQALEDLQEEARKAGVPPGWLR